MTIFEAVKSMVTPRIAAEHYGMTVARNGMVCCPFHDDRHPSMKLNEDYFYCFGCGAKRDVIEFTSKLFGITALEAAQKLSADFGVQEGKPSVLTKLNRYKTQAENERLCFRVLSDYLRILQGWMTDCAPQSPDDEPDFRYAEACHMLEHVKFSVELLTEGVPEERAELIKDLLEDDKIIYLQERVKRIKEESNEQS